MHSLKELFMCSLESYFCVISVVMREDCHSSLIFVLFRGRCVKTVMFIVIYRFVVSCKKNNSGYPLVKNCLCAYSSFILVFISLVAAQRGK